MKLKLATKLNWRVQRISRDFLRAPSVWFIVALAALALLEIPSTTGRLLDRWGADVVAGWLGQLALLGLCVDALRGKLPRPVVLIPLLFYFSYYFAYWEQGLHIKLKSEELWRTNPGRIVVFDPRSSSLAMEKADAFAASYSVPVAYARDPSFVGDEYLSYRLVATDKIGRFLSRNRDSVQIFSVYWNDAIVPNVRELKYPERPQHQIISVSVADNPGQGWKDFNIGTQTTSVSTDGRLIGTFRSAYVLRLPPLPMFTLGCTQSLTSSKRMCRAEFVTERVPIESRPDSVDRALYQDPRSEPVRETAEVAFIDSVERHDGCALHDLVFQGGDRERPLPPIGLRYVRPARRLRSISSPVDPSMKIVDPRFEVRLVVVPRHAIHAGGGLALKRVERRPESLGIDVVEERGELSLLPSPCGFTYAVQRLGHAHPALGPVRALLVRVPRGPRPWLRRLLSQLPGFVRRLRGYYAGV